MRIVLKKQKTQKQQKIKKNTQKPFFIFFYRNFEFPKANLQEFRILQNLIKN